MTACSALLDSLGRIEVAQIEHVGPPLAEELVGVAAGVVVAAGLGSGIWM